MNDNLAKTLKKLRLSGLLESLEVRLHEAQSHQLNHLEFLELILQDELAVRSDRQRQRRVKAAGFRELKTLEDFDWSFNPSVPRKRVYELATGRYLQDARDVLWLGPPGVGKSFLVQALGYQAIRAGHHVLYRSIFDLVHDFAQDEALGGVDRILTRYLKPDLLIVD
jgi:DNA replication protein DnaC